MERVRITLTLCSNNVQYVAPVLADTIRVSERISLVIDRAELPFSNSGEWELAGRVAAHKVRVDPSPLVQELAVLLGSKPLVRREQGSTISFRLINGRVHHHGLHSIFPVFSIRTNGSVGLDGTLDLTVEVAILSRRLGSSVLHDLVSNHRIRLPVYGTLSRPKFDERS